jgi:hypothetical protein
VIVGSFFFAVAGSEIFYCRALAQGNDGMRAVCLNRHFEATLDADGTLPLPHCSKRRARVELVVSPQARHFDPRDHHAAIAYFLKRKAVRSL